MIIPIQNYSTSEAADVVAIQDLLVRYCYAHDFSHAADVAALFHRDAVVYSMYENDVSYRGRDAIRDWYGPSVDDIKISSRFSYRTISNPVISLKGNRAHSVCMLEAYGISLADGISRQFFGRYVDNLIKEEGRWSILRREIRVEHVHASESFQLCKPGQTTPLHLGG